jgi:large subunit ribosomal protein L18
MNKDKEINGRRQRRRFRVRKRLRGDAQRPRLSVFRTSKHVYCQVIDDESGKTLISASTRDKSLRDSVGNGGNKEAAQAVGKAIAERALAAGIQAVRFDRGHYKYHGRVAALADAAREAGLGL